MNDLTRKINMQYLQQEIVKMKNTVKELEKMIKEKDPIRDRDLIETLKKLYSTTINSINDKKKELKEIYNKDIEIDNN